MNKNRIDSILYWWPKDRYIPLATNCFACSGLPLKQCTTQGCGSLPAALHSSAVSFRSRSSWSKAFTQCTINGLPTSSARDMCALITSICTSICGPRSLSRPHSPMAHTLSCVAMDEMCARVSCQFSLMSHGCMPTDAAACAGRRFSVSLQPMLHRYGTLSMVCVWILYMLLWRDCVKILKCVLRAIMMNACGELMRIHAWQVAHMRHLRVWLTNGICQARGRSHVLPMGGIAAAACKPGRDLSAGHAS